MANKPIWTNKHTKIVERYIKRKKEGKVKEFAYIVRDEHYNK